MNFLKKVIGPKSPLFSGFLPRLAAGTVNTANFSMFDSKITETRFLLPKNVMVTPLCGLKIKGNVLTELFLNFRNVFVGQMRLRCKDCYYVRKEGRLYVMCNSFPRHKQTHLVKREKFTWIFSHACQSQLRPY